jgi:hypothetical protein
MPTSMKWSLFIDESGAFEGPVPGRTGLSSAVGGLLVRADCEAVSPRRLREALTSAFPEVPWPLHATYARIPAMYALWRRGEPAFEWLVQRQPEDLDQVLAAIDAGRDPDYDVVRRLDAHLRVERPDLHASLSVRASAFRDRVRRLLERVQRAQDEPALLFVAAAEASAGEAFEAARDDPYLTMLEVLLERVLDALAQLPGRHVVHVSALRRDVHEPRLRRGVPLHARHLGLTIERAHLATRGSPPNERDPVRLVPATTPRYDPSVAAGLVLADLVSNLTIALLSVDVTLSALERGVRSTTALSIDWPGGGLPSTAASGAPRELVARAREAGARPPSDALPDGLLQWTAEQGRRWAHHLRQAREVAP